MSEQNKGTFSPDVHHLLSDKEGARVAEVAQQALDDGMVLEAVVQGVLSKEDAFRYNCVKVLTEIGEQQPAVLIPYWDFFVELLDSINAYHRATGVNVLALLVEADTEGRFEAVFTPYFDLLDDDKVVVARYVARNAGRIALARPKLQGRIAEQLLAIDETHHQEGRKALVKVDALDSFEAFMDNVKDRERVLALAEGMLASSSPKARETARAFLQRYG